MKDIKITIHLSLFVFFVNSVIAYADPLMCTYETYKWNVKLKRAVDRKIIKHSYSNLSKEEVSSTTGCTVCKEDQVEINLPGLKPFYICKLLANDIRHTLLNLIRQGEYITEVTGYRVGMTKGKPDNEYNRSQFSNHSYGISLDINPEQNGLYDHCINFSTDCRLIRGGAWSLDNKGSMKKNSSIVKQMKQLGFRWGGEIAGKQKDFMHFSPSGY